MKVSKLVTYLIAGGLCIILLIFLVKVAPRLLIASRPMQATQATPTATFTKSTPQTMPNVVSVISTPTIASGSINVAASQETTTEITWCTFDAQAVPAQATLPLDAYTFAEPRIVLTSTTEIALLQWISETQSLLLRSHPSSDSPKRVIETFNPQTGERKRYAEAQLASFEPVWVAKDQSVLFVERLPNGQQVLRRSRGIEQPIADIALDVPSGSITIDQNHQQALLLSNASTKQAQVTSISFTESAQIVTSLASVPIGLQGRYGITLSPDGTQAAIYGREGFYIQNRATEQLCRVDLGRVGQDSRWGSRIQWSSDGKYLALITTYGVNEGELLHVMDLTLLDMNTGRQRQVEFGGRYAYRIYWLPDSYVILVTVADEHTPLSGLKNLYLVNAITGATKDILPGYGFPADNIGIHWTADEKTIFVPCDQATDLGANYNEYRICAIVAGEQQ